MDRNQFLRLSSGAILIALVVSSFILTAPSSVAANGSCPASQMMIGQCPTVSGEISGGGVNVGGSQTSPGNGSGGSNGGSGSDSGAGSGSGAGAVETIPCPFPCRPPFTVTDLTERPVTLTDIAHFRPRPGINHMQPAGWMIVDLDTNFYSTGGSQLHNGTLFDFPADVRFTPIRWHWTYGDGNRESHTGSGTTWAGNRVGEFDPTPTSHSYRAPGTYVIDLTINFRAEYRFAGQAWTNIPGSIAVPANRLTASAGTAKTVLVDRECTRNPRGPGC